MQVAQSLADTGAVLIRDARVSEEANSAFLSMMERYFEQSDGVADARPEISYQVCYSKLDARNTSCICTVSY
jgi:hypothetical protein